MAFSKAQVAYDAGSMLAQVISALGQLTEKCVDNHSQFEQFETAVNCRLTAIDKYVSRLENRPPIEKSRGSTHRF